MSIRIVHASGPGLVAGALALVCVHAAFAQSVDAWRPAVAPHDRRPLKRVAPVASVASAAERITVRGSGRGAA
ncbi:MAG: hypothetical protein ABF893_18165, partial [Gluconacetobacter liquefaciens]